MRDPNHATPPPSGAANVVTGIGLVLSAFSSGVISDRSASLALPACLAVGGLMLMVYGLWLRPRAGALTMAAVMASVTVGAAVERLGFGSWWARGLAAIITAVVFVWVGQRTLLRPRDEA